MAQATRFPQLALTGAVGVASSQLSSQTLGPLLIEHIGASLSGPLLNATALGMQVTVNETRAQQAACQYQKAVVNALKEVEDALIAVQKYASSGRRRSGK